MFHQKTAYVSTKEEEIGKKYSKKIFDNDEK